MVLTITINEKWNLGSISAVKGTIAFDDSYPTNGESLTASMLGVAEVKYLEVQDYAGYAFQYDYTNAKLKAFFGGGDTVTPAGTIANTTPASEAITVTDNDDAGTAGVALYAHTKNGRDAWIEFVSPTNADGTGTLSNGGSAYFIFDSDGAATDGVQIYFDEDGTNADERFLIVSPTGADLMVTLPGGKVLRLKHDADAATKGVAAFFDEDAANTYGRLQFVSPTDTAGAGATDDSLLGNGSQPTSTFTGNSIAATAADEVGNTADLSGLTTAPFIAFGRF